TGIEEQRGDVLRVGGAAAVPEGEQPPARAERVRHPGGAGREVVPVVLQDGLAQPDDVVRLLGGRAADVVHDDVQPGAPGGQERIQLLHVGHFMTPMASLAWTSTMSPATASTSATLTCSTRPSPASTSARPSSPIRRTRTATASSEHVTQWSPAQCPPSGPSSGGVAENAVMGEPPSLSTSGRSRNTWTSSQST